MVSFRLFSIIGLSVIFGAVLVFVRARVLQSTTMTLYIF